MFGKLKQIQGRLLMAQLRHSEAREARARNDESLHRNPVPLQRWHFTT
jgi:hypothetical protein